MTNGKLVKQIAEDFGGIDSALKQVRISHVRRAGALMEVRSLFGLNSVVEKTRDGRTDRRTDGPTDQRTDPLIESLVRD